MKKTNVFIFGLGFLASSCSEVKNNADALRNAGGSTIEYNTTFEEIQKKGQLSAVEFGAGGNKSVATWAGVESAGVPENCIKMSNSGGKPSATDYAGDQLVYLGLLEEFHYFASAGNKSAPTSEPLYCRYKEQPKAWWAKTIKVKKGSDSCLMDKNCFNSSIDFAASYQIEKAEKAFEIAKNAIVPEPESRRSNDSGTTGTGDAYSDCMTQTGGDAARCDSLKP